MGFRTIDAIAELHITESLRFDGDVGGIRFASELFQAIVPLFPISQRISLAIGSGITVEIVVYEDELHRIDELCAIGERFGKSWYVTKSLPETVKSSRTYAKSA